jgi:hypothetical protein
MAKQVFVLSIGGGIKGTHLRAGNKGIDISKLGKASITRASDIIWKEEYQRWSVYLLEGSYNNSYLTKGLYYKITGEHVPAHVLVGEDGLLLCETHEEAVSLEVRFLNSYRKHDRF